MSYSPWGGPSPDPLLEGKYARPRTFKDMAGGLILGVVAFALVFGVAALVLSLVK